jgi:recombination protein RecT
MSNIKPMDEFRNSLKLLEPQFKMALPNHIPVERFIRVAQTAIQSNPHLLTLDRSSLFAACVKSAQDGLLPNGSEAALVPFKDKVQYLPMVGGILKKIRNSGELSSITSQLVYEKDEFKYWIDSDGEHLKHEPNMFVDRGDLIGVYALAKTKDGGVYIEVMTMAQVDDIKKSSRSNNGPWQGPFFTEMIKKSAIRRLSKRLPMSTDLESTLSADDDLYSFEQPKQDERPAQLAAPAVDKTKPTRLKKAMAKAKEESAIEVEAMQDEVPGEPGKEATL